MAEEQEVSGFIGIAKMVVARNRMWRLSEIAFSALAVISFVTFLGLHYYFLGSRSNFPDSAAQAIYPLNEHGRIVYVAWLEFNALRVLFWAAMICFFFAAIIDVRINPFGRKYPFSKKIGR